MNYIDLSIELDLNFFSLFKYVFTKHLPLLELVITARINIFFKLCVKEKLT